MFFLLKYIGKYKWFATLAPLFKMLEAIFELLVPLVVADMIDNGIGKNDPQHIIICGLLLLALAVLGMAVSITAQFFAAKAAILSTKDMRRDVYAHIMDFSEASMDKTGASALLTRLTSDLNQVMGGINMVLRLFLRSPFVVFGAMIMAGTISLRALALFAIVIALLGGFTAILMHTTIPMYTNVQNRLEGLITLTRENLEGARVIRAFVRDDKEREEFDRRNDRLRANAYKAGGYQSFLNPVTFVLVNMGIVVLLYTSGLQVNAGTLTTGEAVALYNYMSQILVELIKFANLIVQITRAWASVIRVREVMEMTADERSHIPDDEPFDLSCETAIDFSNVTFSYNKNESRNALEELTFCVPKNSTLGIVGGTGSGKSTITRLIRHAYDASAGTVRLFGRDVRRVSDSELSSIISNVPQKVTLFSGTVAENMRLGNKDASDEEIIEALKKAKAYDFVMEKNGLATEVAPGGTNFSGGQRQRLSIARAIVSHPKILILDDSTSALDAATERALLGELMAQKELTIIIISQRSTSVSWCDRILVMEDGWCIGSGTDSWLIKNNEVYREIVEAGR